MLRCAYGPRQNRKSKACSPSRATSTWFARPPLRKACIPSSRSSGLSSTSRISTCSCPMRHLWRNTLAVTLFFSYREIKHRTLADFCLRPGMATMLLHDALHGRQTYPGSWKIFWEVQPLENSEKLVGVLHTETDSVVAYKDGRFGPPV